jgi:hypothetical protein
MDYYFWTTNVLLTVLPDIFNQITNAISVTQAVKVVLGLKKIIVSLVRLIIFLIKINVLLNVLN